MDDADANPYATPGSVADPSHGRGVPLVWALQQYVIWSVAFLAGFAFVLGLGVVEQEMGRRGVRTSLPWVRYLTTNWTLTSALVVGSFSAMVAIFVMSAIRYVLEWWRRHASDTNRPTQSDVR